MPTQKRGCKAKLLVYKKLIIIVALVQLLAIISGCLLVFLGDRKCMTAPCYKLAAMINDYMRNDISPCDDFYTFACGNMLEGSDKYRTLADRAKEPVLMEIANFLETVEEGSQPEVFYTAKLLYKQCMERNETSKEVKENVNEFIRNCGDFPALDGAAWDKTSEEEFDLAKALKRLAFAGLSTDAFFSVTGKRSPSNKNRYMFCISPAKPYLLFTPQFLASCNYECQKLVLDVYCKILRTVGVAEAEVRKEAQELLSYDMKIANLTYKLVPGSPYDDVGYLITFEELKLKYNFFNWNVFVGMIWMAVHSNDTSTSIKEEELIILEYPEYMDGIKALIESSSKRQLANYLVWYNLLQFMYYPELPRSPTFCLDSYMAHIMPVMVNALAARTEITSNYGTAKRMVKNIAAELIREIEISTWIDENAKQVVLDKIEDMAVEVGYWDWLMDDELIDTYFSFPHKSKLEVGKTFYRSYTGVLKKKMQRNRFCIRTSFENILCQLMLHGETSLVPPQTHYNVLENKILVTDSTLRQPFFSKYWPRFIVFSRLGFLLGHDFIHMLDNRGSHFDKTGNVASVMSNYTMANLMKKAYCFHHQVSQYQFFDGNKKTNLPSNTTVIENIADNGGLTLSFQAYQKNRNWLSISLPSVNYNPDQLFFISLAHMFCKQYRPHEYPAAFYNRRAPNPIRIEQLVQNSPYFSEAFKCEAGSPMNPDYKCFIF